MVFLGMASIFVWVHHHWHQLLFKIRSCSPTGGGGVGVGVHHHWHQLLFKLRSCSPNGLGAPPWAPASFFIKNRSPNGLGHHHWHQLLFKLRSCSPNGLGAPPWAPASFCIKNCSPIGWWCPHPHTTPHHTHNLVGNSFCNLKQKLAPMVVLPTKIHATPKTPLAPASFFN